MSPTTQANSNSLVSNRQGFLPLPSDTIESYSHRVARQMAPDVGNEKSARDHVINTYDMDPFWVPIHYSSKGLRLWEAGCTWYSDDADTTPEIQLTAHFEHKDRFLGMYNKDEVLAHEYVHAARAQLGSSAFEEFFSYLLSLNFANGPFSKILCGIRVFLGPLFEKPWEAALLVFCMILPLLFAVTDLFHPVSLVPFAAVFLYLGVRLVFRWRILRRCKAHLDIYLGVSSLPLMVRLTDDEIRFFSKLCPESCCSWIDTQTNFRWQLLKSAYFPRRDM